LEIYYPTVVKFLFCELLKKLGLGGRLKSVCSRTTNNELAPALLLMIIKQSGKLDKFKFVVL